MVGIYKITSPSNNLYIGQSRDICKRWSRYKDIKSYQRQPSIFRSFKKYGINSHKFEVICELPYDITQDVLDEYEKLYMSAYRECGGILLNIKEGGLFGSHGKETRMKIGKSKIGNKNMLGKKHTNETKLKISLTKKGKSPAWNKGKAWSEEARAKMYKFPKGHIPYNKGKEHKVHTEDTRRKMSEIHKKHWAYRKENGISISAKGEQSNSKLLKADVLSIRNKLELGIYTRIIANEFNVSQSTIMAIKKRKTWKHI